MRSEILAPVGDNAGCAPASLFWRTKLGIPRIRTLLIPHGNEVLRQAGVGLTRNGNLTRGGQRGGAEAGKRTRRVSSSVKCDQKCQFREVMARRDDCLFYLI